MNHDQVLQKVGEIQTLHPDWDPNDIYEALCTTNFNNAQAILKLMIQDKSRRASIEPSPRKSASESPFAAVGMLQQQYYKEQREKRELAGVGTIVDYFDRNNNGGNNSSRDDNTKFPAEDEENYYDDDFQTNEKNNTSSLSSPKKSSVPQRQQTNLQRSRDTRNQGHVAQSQYAFSAKEKPAKKSTASQSQINTFVTSNKNEAENKSQASYKSQYNYFGSGFTLRSKSNVHSKVEISSKKRKRSKVLDDFWNSDDELEEVCANNSSYNSDSDNSSYKKTQRISPSEKIKSFKSKYFQHEKIDSEEKNQNKIDKNGAIRTHGEELEEENYAPQENVEEYEDNNNIQYEQQYYDENHQEERKNIENYEDNTGHIEEGQDNVRYEDEQYDEEIPHYDEELAQPHYDGQTEEFQQEYFEEENKEQAANEQRENIDEIDAKIAEDGPSLFIPTILVDSETPDPILISDSDSSQLTAPTTNSSISSNNPILIDSSPIRNESSTETKNNRNNNVQMNNSGNNSAKIDAKSDNNAYFEKIRNATANKRRKIILD